MLYITPKQDKKTVKGAKTANAIKSNYPYINKKPLNALICVSLLFFLSYYIINLD